MSSGGATAPLDVPSVVAHTRAVTGTCFKEVMGIVSPGDGVSNQGVLEDGYSDSSRFLHVDAQ